MKVTLNVMLIYNKKYEGGEIKQMVRKLSQSIREYKKDAILTPVVWQLK